jgi:hypothetical protein
VPAGGGAAAHEAADRPLVPGIDGEGPLQRRDGLGLAGRLARSTSSSQSSSRSSSRRPAAHSSNRSSGSRSPGSGLARRADRPGSPPARAKPAQPLEAPHVDVDEPVRVQHHDVVPGSLR